jgi:drug/metabolite transporter (DMT)-like permease
MVHGCEHTGDCGELYTSFLQPVRRSPIGRNALLTVAALIAFASNSILCRLALGRAAIDPASFTALRVSSGAMALWLLASLDRRRHPRRTAPPGLSRAGWRSGFFLFAYAVAFSFAYVTLTASTGALILFPAVQVTIMVGAMLSGERLRALEWCGLALAISGLVYLTLPGLSAPPLAGSLLMVCAGIAWGLYTLRGRGSPAPLHDTARNFLCAAAPALVTAMLVHSGRHITAPGAGLALASGIAASGIGYVVWYAALRGLTATRAAMVQLAVPVIAALGGVIFLTESISARLIISACLILGGIGLALVRHSR